MLRKSAVLSALVLASASLSGVSAQSLMMLEMQERQIRESNGMPEAQKQMLLGQIKQLKERVKSMPAEMMAPPFSSEEEAPGYRPMMYLQADWPLPWEPIYHRGGVFHEVDMSLGCMFSPVGGSGDELFHRLAT